MSGKDSAFFAPRKTFQQNLNIGGYRCRLFGDYSLIIFAIDIDK